jgi:hypothetical protein
MDRNGLRNVPRLAQPLKQQSVLPPDNPYEKKIHYPTEQDIRPRFYKPLEHVLVPKFNTLYDSLRSTQGWKYMADAMAKGTITTTPGATASAQVTLATDPKFRLEQWPGGVQVYLAIRFFGIVPQAVPTANGGMEVVYIDGGGNQAPLGEYLSQSGGNSNYDVILPNAITDPGTTSLGTLTVTQANVASSGGTFQWSIGYSALYLLPARYGYEIMEDEEYEALDGHHNHNHKNHPAE